MTHRIAIVGAGVAGLAAARVLAGQGFDVTLFDKSRGVGGRMATRRADGLQFDHGAQYFTARGERFRAQAELWALDGRAAEWAPGWFVGTAAMTAPARALAEGLAVTQGRTVSALRRGPDGWSLSGRGPDGDALDGPFAAVVLATPAPQAVPIAASAGLGWPGMQSARYAPCWALLLAFDAPIGLAAASLRPDDDVLAWIARDSTKPGRPLGAETLVAHATPAWSRAHLEDAPETVQAALLARVRQLTGLGATPRYAAAHRWRYALVDRPAGEPFLWDSGARVGACGDWCIGPRIEAAFDSGEALAFAMARDFGGRDGR
jgi:predicted NAD/FAD-dependent oxidoreductase